MDQEVKQRWVEALRSGEYEQGKGRLGTLVDGEEKPKYCCLGVLCEVRGVGTWVVDTNDDVVVMKSNGSISYPGTLFAQEVGLTDRYGTFPIELRELVHHDTLARLNDDGFTFSQIADLIEWAF